jgi:hypothetical protein
MAGVAGLIDEGDIPVARAVDQRCEPERQPARRNG